MEKVYDVIGVENPIMDFAVSIDRLPKTDSMSVMHDYLWQSGGNASSAIAALARLGAKWWVPTNSVHSAVMIWSATVWMSLICIHRREGRPLPSVWRRKRQKAGVFWERWA